jgi:translation elongation factor EF-4
VRDALRVYAARLSRFHRTVFFSWDMLIVLELLPVVNKIDLSSADPGRALEQMRTNFELDPKKAILVSAKTGLNVEAVLPAVIEQAPP